MSRCLDCNFVICQCFNALQESAAQSCLPPTNVINVEFRSDARRIAELEERVAALERRIDVFEARCVLDSDPRVDDLEACLLGMAQNQNTMITQIACMVALSNAREAQRSVCGD